jgi:hypothetical protein
MVGLLQAPPGTRLYECLKQAGRLLEQMSGDNVDGTNNIVPTVDLDTLREGYGRILQHIYSPAPYYQRIRTFLGEYKPPKLAVPRDLAFVREMALAFIRSVYRLGIRGQERVHYWRLLWWTLFRRPKLSPVAVTLAIYGYHFRTISEQHIL